MRSVHPSRILLNRGKGMIMELSFSTDPDWCSKCKHLPCQCGKSKPASLTSGTGKVKMRRERRRGKDMIVVFETRMNKSNLQSLIKEIRKSCGAGGTVKGDTLEVQGDHRDKIKQILESRGLKVTWAGG